MTGTFLSTPTNAFSQYKFLQPNIFEKQWTNFLKRYVATYEFRDHKPKTFKNLKDLNTKVQSITFQLSREKTNDFPKEQYQTIHFELTNPTLRHYQEMENELKTIVETSEVNTKIVLTQTLRLQQITKNFLPVQKPNNDLATNMTLNNNHMQALIELLKEYSPKEPLMIFYRFRYELSAILKQLKKMKRSANFIAKKMRKTTRDQAKTNFQKEKMNTYVIQIHANEITIELSRTNTNIFYSLTHSFINYEQAKAWP